MSKREAFLLWILAGLLTWQAGIFTYGVHICSRVETQQGAHPCPGIGDRYERFVETSLAAVLGLIAGGALPRRKED